jgi:hypothetical protein
MNIRCNGCGTVFDHEPDSEYNADTWEANVGGRCKICNGLLVEHDSEAEDEETRLHWGGIH